MASGLRLIVERENNGSMVRKENKEKEKKQRQPRE
jgi:hypothetical protein